MYAKRTIFVLALPRLLADVPVTKEWLAGLGLGGSILAAGFSSRMGEYKPLIDIEGRSMIKYVVDMMRKAGAKTVVVVTGYRHEDLEEHLKKEQVEFVFNPDYATTQQLESLKLGLHALA